MTTMSGIATTEAVRYSGAQPVLVNVASHTLNMPPPTLEVEAAITARIFCLRVIENANHAFSTFDGKLIDPLSSDATIFSFYSNTTFDERGMVIMRNLTLAERVKLVRTRAIKHNILARFTVTTASWFNEAIAAGSKRDLIDIASAIGVDRAADPERAYRRTVLHATLGYYVRYVREHSFWSDLRIFSTLSALVD